MTEILRCAQNDSICVILRSEATKNLKKLHLYTDYIQNVMNLRDTKKDIKEL